MRNSEDTKNHKDYLDYLDKEMSIMGILSGLSVIAPGGILSAIMASDKSAATQLWLSSSLFIVAGAAFCIIAGLCFYKQRSTLAWLYGQICLTEALETDPNGVIRQWLREADSWEAWWPYSWGFTFLVAGAFEYLVAAFIHLAPPRWLWLGNHLHIFKIAVFFVCPAVAMVVAAVQWYVLKRYKFSDDYWGEFWSDIWMRRKETKHPHAGVFARLGSSPIHGVGVFAISDIPKGTYVFEPDDDETVKVPSDAIRPLPAELRKLYEDFCVLEGGTYECPCSFNRLTSSWYLNHSAHPNVAADRSLKFYTTREIHAGEELTADYGSYSENESNQQLQ